MAHEANCVTPQVNDQGIFVSRDVGVAPTWERRLRRDYSLSMDRTTRHTIRPMSQNRITLQPKAE